MPFRQGRCPRVHHALLQAVATSPASRGWFSTLCHMRLRLRHLFTAVLALGVLLGLPTAAHAARNDVIRELDIHLEVQPSGTGNVTENYTWDCRRRQGLGVIRLFSPPCDS